MRPRHGRQLNALRTLWGALAGASLILAGWTLWRGEASFIVFLVLAAAFVGAAFGAGRIDESRERLEANDNES